MTHKLFSPDDAYRIIQNHQLYPVSEQKPILAFYLKERPDWRMQSTFIMFTPEGIVICGDMCPARHGVIVPGYGLDWFASQLDPRYLAEKCLDSNHFDAERAENDVEEYLADLVREARDCQDRKIIKTVREIKAALARYTNPYEDAFTLRDCLEEAVSYSGGDWERLFGLGHGYNISDFAWLSAIQRRFAETYKAYQAALEQVGVTNEQG